MTATEAIKVVWLGDYFKISELLIIMIYTFITTHIDNENVVQFINESYAKSKRYYSLNDYTKIKQFD